MNYFSLVGRGVNCTFKLSLFIAAFIIRVKIRNNLNSHQQESEYFDCDLFLDNKILHYATLSHFSRVRLCVTP